MADQEKKPVIVIKRIKKGGHGHHGGAWKIAYADFVTAMMAFFLLMWLLGSTTQGDLKGISDFFNTPFKVALMGGSGSGSTTSVTDAGGRDLSRVNGQVKRADVNSERTTQSRNAEREAQKIEGQRLKKLKEEIENIVEKSESMQPFKEQIKLDVTQEGLRIQIVDEQNRPMFDSGKAILKDYMTQIMKEITSVLNEVDNKITISGHTDAAPYSTGERGYSNWELSADRANACRRTMLASGLADRKILRVVGLASSVPLHPTDPYHPSNRRIAIIVMNKKAEQAVLNQTLPGGGDTTIDLIGNQSGDGKSR